MTIEEFKKLQEEFVNENKHNDLFVNEGSEYVIRPVPSDDSPEEFQRFWFEHYDELAIAYFIEPTPQGYETYRQNATYKNIR